MEIMLGIMRYQVRWIVRYEFESHCWPLNKTHFKILKLQSYKKYLSWLSPTTWHPITSGKWSFSLCWNALVGNHNVIYKKFHYRMARIVKNYFLIQDLFIYLFIFTFLSYVDYHDFVLQKYKTKLILFIWQSFKCLKISILFLLNLLVKGYTS